MPWNTAQRNARPSFIADESSISRVPGGRQIDWANVGNKYRSGAVTVDVGAAGAAAAATTVPVSPALSGPIPKGGIIDFGAPGTKFIRLAAAAAAGATSLTTDPLPTALVDADVGYYWDPGAVRIIKAGTAVGDLLGAGKVSPRVLTTNPAMALLETDAVEGDTNAPYSGYGLINAGNVYEQLLPDAVGGPPPVLPAAIKTELNAVGVGYFTFFRYEDVR